MKAAYLDGAMGLTPVSVLGALIDLGAGAAKIESGLKGMKLGRWRLKRGPDPARAIACTRASFEFDGTSPRLSTPTQIGAAISRSGLPVPVKRSAAKTYSLLAKAESRVHRVPMRDVHFHEVGDAKSILAVAGALLALRLLGVKAVYCSPLPFCRGTVKTEHGLLPLPAPATLELLRGTPMSPAALPGELVTPSGAALARTLAAEFGPPPAWTPTGTGYGAGREPVLTRVILGETHGRKARS